MDSGAIEPLPEVPQALIEAAVTGHLVVFVGAGASKDAGLPNWQELLVQLVDRARHEASTEEERKELEEVEGWCQKFDLPEAASFLRQKKGLPWLQSSIASMFRAATGQPTPTHDALATLSGTTFITTNYDSLLERALEKRLGYATRVVMASELEALRDLAVSHVLKLHGDVERGEIVLAVEDYFHISRRAASAWKERFKSFLQGNHRLLFVGFSYTDLNIQTVVDELRGAYQESNHRPFWLTQGGLKAKAKAEAYGLELISLSSYKQVTAWLQKLAQSIEAKKAQAPALVQAALLAEVAQDQLKHEQERAHQLFDEQQFEKAESAYMLILRQAEELARAAPGNKKLQQLTTVSRINVACCLLCLQRGPEALPLFQQVAEHELTLLSDEPRAILSQGLAQLGDLERARGVLPHTTHGPRVHEARMLLQLLEGQLPEGESFDSPMLAFHRARLLFDRGLLDEAGRSALKLLERTKDDGITTLLVLGLLVEALRNSVLEDFRTSHWIPPSEREALVEALETGLRRLDDISLPSSLLDLKEKINLVYSSLTDKRDDVKRIKRSLTLSVQEPAEERLSWLSSPEHPWWTQFLQAISREGARSDEQVQKDVLELARKVPGRAPIEYEAARQLRMADRIEEALPHARASFEALPGWGQRLMLAECLLFLGQALEANYVLAPLENSEHPQALRARAYAAEKSSPAEALKIWKRYLGVRPDDFELWLRLPQLLFQTGKSNEAAEAAWAAFEKGRDQYDPQQLYQCAQFQRLSGRFGDDAKERVREILSVLESRFPGNPEAESYRFRLLGVLGFPQDAAPVDYDRLVKAGVLRPITEDELSKAMQSMHQRQEWGYQQYRLGRLSFESLCSLTETPAAIFLTEIIFQSSGDKGQVLLSAPVDSIDKPPAPSLAGQQILAGEVELLLLQCLGLLRKLHGSLGAEGRLFLFQDVWDNLVKAAVTLEQRTQRVELEELERRLAVSQEEHDKGSLAKEISRLRAFIDAAELATATHRAVAAGRTEGWVEVRQRPLMKDFSDVPEHEGADGIQLLVRTPMVDALSYHQALVESPQLCLLSADAYTVLPYRSLVGSGVGLNLVSREERAKMISLVRSVSDRVLHLPALTRVQMAGTGNMRVLRERLVKLGFVTALDAKDLVELLRRYGSGGGRELQRVLDRMEWVVGEHQHCFSPEANLRLVNLYSKAIWLLFCREPEIDGVQAGLLARLLLERAEALDRKSPSNILSALLHFLLLSVCSNPLESFVDDSSRKMIAQSLETNNGRLLSFVARWAEQDSGRRAAYWRALQEAFVDLEEHSLPERQVDIQRVALSLAFVAFGDGSSLLQGIDAQAILSANWPSSLAAPIEQKFQEWARLLETQGPLGWDEVFMAFSKKGKAFEGAAPEAILLRAKSNVVKEWAPVLASVQGVHDGRVHELLMKLAAEPDSKELRSRLAHVAVTSPWRRVRDDPTFLAAWAWRNRYGMQLFPANLDDICLLLSEPSVMELKETLAKNSLREVLAARLEDNGAWVTREDRTRLAMQSSEVPGELAVLPIAMRLESDDYAYLVEQALGRLSNAHEHPAGRLAGDILFLRLAASRRPVVHLSHGDTDLRQLLPGSLHQVLMAVSIPSISEPNRITLAECEAALLRLCAKVVTDLAAFNFPPLNVGIWLTWRLFQWLLAQIEALTPDGRHAALLALRQLAPPSESLRPELADLLNPYGFAPDRFDHRLGSVLHALGIMEEVQESTPVSESNPPESPQGVSSAALEDLLIQLSNRPLTETEVHLRARDWNASCLGWTGPSTVPDLALNALLEINDEGLLRLPPEQRMRWLRELPRFPKDTGRVPWPMAVRICNAFLCEGPILSEEEKRTFAEYLRAVDTVASPEAKALRWLGLTGLFAAGLENLEAEVKQLLIENLAEGQAVKALGLYLTAVASHTPARLECEAELLFSHAEKLGLDLLSFIESLVRMVAFSSRIAIATVHAMLLKFSERPPFQGNERMHRLLGTLVDKLI